MKSEYLDACKKAAKTVSPLCEGCKLWHGCIVDVAVKQAYNDGNNTAVNKFLRKLPSEMLKLYLDDGLRSPTEISAIILDELQKRNETENSMRL